MKTEKKIQEYKKELNENLEQWNAKKDDFLNIIIECSNEEHLYYKEYDGTMRKKPFYDWITSTLNSIKHQISTFDREFNQLISKLNTLNIQNVYDLQTLYNMTEVYAIEWEYDLPRYENTPCNKLWNTCSGLSSNAHLIYLTKEYREQWREIFKIVKSYNDLNAAIAQNSKKLIKLHKDGGYAIINGE